jgi:hypothetical protein
LKRRGHANVQQLRQQKAKNKMENEAASTTDKGLRKAKWKMRQTKGSEKQKKGNEAAPTDKRFLPNPPNPLPYPIPRSRPRVTNLLGNLLQRHPFC